jgi:glycosyltransferase involved in cell wall biosynthesis
MGNKKKKIALFLPSLIGGGVKRVFVNLANCFSQKGFAVDMLLAQQEGPYLSNISKGINVVDLRSKKVIFSFFPLARYLKKEKPDILISAISRVNIMVILAKFFSGSGIDVILTEHDMFSIVQKRIPFLRRIAVKLFVKLLYSRAKAVIAVSYGVAKDLDKNAGIPKNKLHVIYNPINISDIERKAQDTAIHPWLQKGFPVILGVGRLAYQKDFPTLIKAFHKLNKKIENTKLIILGEGIEREKLEKLIKELGISNDVDMPGFISNPYAYMARAGVFVLSSTYEGLPTVLIEAMACGAPVASTDCPSGPSEILENGKYGKLVPVGNADALAEAIEETLNNPIDSRKLRMRAAFFSQENSIRKYLKVMEL